MIGGEKNLNHIKELPSKKEKQLPKIIVLSLVCLSFSTSLNQNQAPSSPTDFKQIKQSHSEVWKKGLVRPIL